jgi:RNA polymerase sigma-70 factor (ECF subfamily)
MGETRQAVDGRGRLQAPAVDGRQAEVGFYERVAPSAEQREDLDTARWVVRFQGGETKDAFATLYSRYFDRVYGYLRVMLRDPHEAEDIAQQALMEVFESLPRYERRAQPFRAWLFRIVRNQGLMQLRRSRRLEVTDPQDISERQERAGANGDPEAATWLSDKDLMLFIERLPFVQRQVLAMRYMLDLSATEMATVLDMSPDAVRAAQSRATRVLRERLRSVGRGARTRRGVPMRAGIRQAPVLRQRRFALIRR